MDALPSLQWEPIPEERRERVERELRCEVGHPDHPLAGVGCRAVARCTMCDDTLFVLPDGRYVVVHLTWSGKPESDPQWPTATTVDSWADLAVLLTSREH
jgi:hypothetical protein